MIFNSFSFCIFFTGVFFLYYFLLKDNTKAQNCLLLLASYFFYGYGEWKMIPLLLLATMIIFFLGQALHKAKNTKKASILKNLGVLTGLGLLFYFKYFNFFIDSFSSSLNAIGLKSNIGTFNIIMPLGISFFTFKLISYIIEVHRGKIEPTKNFVIFSTYISFFPTILSGPIDKPNSFIPQLQKKRSFDYDSVVDGCRQILWGLFKKIVIADNLAIIVNNIWGDFSSLSGSTLLIAAILYSIQLYTDFSGYSHIAIGVGKTLGFRITKNFNYPFFSRSISEFWRNWHMSLTNWVTDYVFIPLNLKFRDLGSIGVIMAIIVNMALVGLWHGANWTYLAFGLFQGLLFIPLILSGSFLKNKKLKTNKYRLPTIADFFKMVRTFLLVTLSCIFIRAENIDQAYSFFIILFSKSLISFPTIPSGMSLGALKILLIGVFILILFIFEWFQRNKEYALDLSYVKKKWLRWLLYLTVFCIIYKMYSGSSDFIYTQF